MKQNDPQSSFWLSIVFWPVFLPLWLFAQLLNLLSPHFDLSKDDNRPKKRAIID